MTDSGIQSVYVLPGRYVVSRTRAAELLIPARTFQECSANLDISTSAVGKIVGTLAWHRMSTFTSKNQGASL